MESLCSAISQFSLDLFKNLSEKQTSNIFYSPLSISSALAMVCMGARGKTAKYNVYNSLHVHKAGDDVHSYFSSLITDINKPGASYQLSLANRLYGEKSFEFLKEFIGKTTTFYHASLEAVDFIQAPEASRKTINAWVEKQTNEKIKNLLESRNVDALTRLVLVNAVYFKGNWEKKFQESETINGQFRINKNETRPIKMMYQKSKFNITYISELKCRILELPYVGNELSMLIMLPSNIEDNSTGLEKLEKSLTWEKLQEWTNPDMMDNEETEVSIPKFKLEEAYDLKKTLMSMGIVDAFDPKRSDFSGMSSNNNLFLSRAIHKSYVEVNEEGTEAAAATAMVFSDRCAFFTMPFTADHPFLFFIRHNKTRSILFYGRFCTP
uniref:Leukocyte elastase inhibitor n=1 Tax=Erpetoichthys calabaricus TaxID=27687 RepID=A0A8C4RPF8_ERPCA